MTASTETSFHHGMEAGPERRPDNTALWDGDTGTLRDASRRALVQLLRGPFLSAERHGHLWAALLNDESEIRSRLADAYLELVVDVESQLAFARNVRVPDTDAPKVMRSHPLTFMDTAMLLHLRQQLLHGDGRERVIVGKDEVADQLQVYREATDSDPAGFAKRINSSWQKMVTYGILAATSTEDRFEVSPMLRLIFGADEIAAVQAEYRRLAARGTHDAETPAGDTATGEEEGTA
ncbi:MAG: DUF4194 domain-containing protein [Actinomycetes bacterium]